MSTKRGSGDAPTIGSSGEGTRDLQVRLREFGYLRGPADGRFGPGTADALKRFQKAHGLPADGRLTPETLVQLESGARGSSAAPNSRSARRTQPEQPPRKGTPVRSFSSGASAPESRAYNEQSGTLLDSRIESRPQEADIAEVERAALAAEPDGSRSASADKALQADEPEAARGRLPQNPLATSSETLLLQRGETAIRLQVHSGIWTLGFDAVVLPSGGGGAMGEFAAAFFEWAGTRVERVVRQALEKGPLLSPGAPVLIPIEPSKQSALPRVVIVATAGDPDFLPEHAGRAAVAAVRLAAGAGLTTIVLPLLGTGRGRLRGPRVLQAMLRDLARAAPFSGVTHVTLVTLDRKLRVVARRAAGQLTWMESVPERASYDSDQDTKEDSLNVHVQACTFAKLLADRDTAMPLSLGLFGKWGAGKSYFMDLMQEEVRQLASRQRADDSRSSYLRRVAQIEFNAWNYVDADLWASLAVRLFDGLAAEYAGEHAAGSETEAARRALHSAVQSSKEARLEAEHFQDAAKRERREASDALASLEAQRVNAAHAYGAAFWRRFLQAATPERVESAKKLAARLGLSDAVETSDDLTRLYQEIKHLHGRWELLLRDLAHRFSSPGRTALALVAVSLVLAATVATGPALKALVGWIGGPNTPWDGLLQMVGRVVVLLGAPIAWASRQLGAVARATTQLESLQGDLALRDPNEGATEKEQQLRRNVDRLDADIHTQQQKIAEAERRMAVAQAELQRINAGGLVYDFAVGRRAATQYQSKLGIVSVIREDFNRLRDLLADWHEHQAGCQAPIERIILYIDDLDRCHPDQVVQVLQAVHLLLAFDLFAVVVAVDARWLERSLYKAYAPELQPMGNRAAPGGDGEFSPQNYLEKIFQVPFSLPAMRPEGYRALIESVIESRGEHLDRGTARSLAAGSTEPGAPPASVQNAPDGVALATTEAVAPQPEPTVAAVDAEPRPAEPSGGPGPAPVLEDWEKHVLQVLHPFVETPRLAKRLVNIYRLLRVRSTTLDGGCFPEFIERDTGEYRAALILLAINVGHPQVAPRLLQHVTGSQTDSWTHCLAELVREGRRGQVLAWTEAHREQLVLLRARLGTVQQGLREIQPRIPFPQNMSAFRRWAPEVGRYSFHWNVG